MADHYTDTERWNELSELQRTDALVLQRGHDGLALLHATSYTWTEKTNSFVSANYGHFSCFRFSSQGNTQIDQQAYCLLTDANTKELPIDLSCPRTCYDRDTS